MKNIYSKLILSVGVLVGFCLLVLFPFYDLVRWSFYDIYLRLKPSIPLHPKLRVVEIDDTTFESLRMYPLSRDLIARGVEKMAELGVEVLLIDSEYVEPSPRVVSEPYLNESLPRKITSLFQDLEESSVSLFQGLLGQSRVLNRGFALQLMSEWPQYLKEVETNLLNQIRLVAQNNDLLLADAIKIQGRAHVTVTPTPYKPAAELSEEHRRLLLDRIALQRLTVLEEDHHIQEWEFVSPTILPILSQAKGAGNVEQYIDSDGTRRRVDILYRWQGKFFPHIALSSLLDWLGDPALVLYKDRLVLRQARHPDGEVQDITIPLDEQGRMIIHWPKGKFDETFPRVSFLRLLKDEEFLERLHDNLVMMDDQQWLSFYQVDLSPLDRWRLAQEFRQARLNESSTASKREYRNLRMEFVESARAFLNSGVEEEIIKSYEELLAQPGRSESFHNQVDQMINLAKEVFEASRNLLRSWDLNRKILQENLEGNWVSLGYTGRSTTDIGVNPFDPNYMNVGTMASIVNTILQKQFLDERPWYWSLFLMLPVVFFLPSLTKRLNPLNGLLVGLGIIFMIQLIYFSIFALMGIYLDAFFAFGVTFSTWLISYVLHFFKSSKEAAYVKDMAGQYVSKTVVNLLIQNPSLLKLGGEKKELTAMFTDVKGFSTISEQLSAIELVDLLNEYLTEMSDIILDELGTIDKYEGDAIIAFFNAPLDVPEHAIRACRSALRMKRAEQRLNPVWLEKKMTPVPLFTRIGINTGEMVHGNMGTNQKKNYTIMGNHVNLAARLEGVNKQYGTAILISENTQNQLNNQFLCRTLDKVRVVGINQPIRLYELVEEIGRADDDLSERIQLFHEGLRIFEERHYAEGVTFFEDFLKRWPDDGPAQTFYKRCREYLQKPPPSDWDGVWNMATK
jgi:adenylate cyclase